MRSLLTVPLLLLICSLSAYGAANVQNLYDVQVDVVDEGEQSRSEALKTGFKQVLIRVSGSLAVVNNEGIKQAINAPTPYVHTYRYQRIANGGERKLKLIASFNRSQVTNLLNQNGIQVWGQRRPTTIVWMAIDDGRNRSIVSRTGNQIPKLELLRAAKLRGIPLVFPTMDQTDQQAVRFTDIWGGFDDAIRSASRRYNADAQLVGRIYRAGNNWTARWTLTIKRNRHSWQSSSPDISVVMSAGANGATDKIAKIVEKTDTEVPVISDSSSSSVLVSVANITGLPSFIAVQKQFAALKKQGAIKTARVVEITSDRVVFAIESRSGSEASAIRQAMGYAKSIKQDSSGGVDLYNSQNNSSSTVLRYRYSP
jgi:hypothetical protein